MLLVVSFNGAFAKTNLSSNDPAKIIFDKKPITDINVLRHRAIYGISDIDPSIFKSQSKISSNKHYKVKDFTTAQKIKEVVEPDGTKVTTYQLTNFSIAAPSDYFASYGPAQWDETYSWECVVNQSVATFQSGGVMYGTLLNGSAKWDSGGQQTNLPTVSNAEVKYGEEGMPYGGGYVSPNKTLSVGTPVQYHVYSYNSSSNGWPYIAASSGDCKTLGKAILHFPDGSTETWYNSSQWGNGVTNPWN